MEALSTPLRMQATPASWAAHHPPVVHVAARVAHRPWTPSHRANIAAPSLVAPALTAEKQAVDELGSIAATAIIEPGALGKLEVDAKGDFPIHDIHDYGQRLMDNKVRLFRVADKMYRDHGKDPYSGTNAQRKAVMMAIAMLETQHMDVNERDTTKDFTPAANNTIFNLNYDMLSHLTDFRSDEYGFELNKDTDATLEEAIYRLDQCFDKAGGIQRILDFHRGGRTGYDNPAESARRGCDCKVYRRAIVTAYDMFNDDPNFLNDGRRIEMDVPYCP